MKNLNTFLLILAFSLALLTNSCKSTVKENHEVSEKEEPQPTPSKEAPITSSKSITDIVANSSDHSTLLEAMKVSGIESVLDEKGPFTFFAPSNAAFELLDPKTKTFMLNPTTKFQSNSVLSYHLVSSKILPKDLKDGQVLKSKHGGDLKVVFKDSKATIAGAKITSEGIEASNGIVYMIDAVLIPVVKK